MMSKTRIKSIQKSVLILFLTSFAYSQNSISKYNIKEFSKDSFLKENTSYSKNKLFDTLYEKQILTALSYFPELKEVKIKFKLKATDTPLSSRPTFWSLFKAAKNRSYVVVISTKTVPQLTPILFENLSYNAQIGVLGHELSHIFDYTNKGFLKMNSIICIELFSKHQVDKFESRTDEICINHGLGFQLLDWSTFVRDHLNVEYWRGANNIGSKSKKERYLNPSTIQQKISTASIYKQ